MGTDLWIILWEARSVMNPFKDLPWFLHDPQEDELEETALTSRTAAVYLALASGARSDVLGAGETGSR